MKLCRRVRYIYMNISIVQQKPNARQILATDLAAGVDQPPRVGRHSGTLKAKPAHADAGGTNEAIQELVRARDLSPTLLGT